MERDCNQFDVKLKSNQDANLGVSDLLNTKDFVEQTRKCSTFNDPHRKKNKKYLKLAERWPLNGLLI